MVYQGLSGNRFLYPIKAVAQRVCHLRAHNAPLSALPARVCSGDGRRPSGLTTKLITNLLRDSVRFLGPKLDFLPKDILARTERAVDTMAFLVVKMDPNVI